MDFSNGLIGLGGIKGLSSQPKTTGLLGQYYDPEEMRRMQMKQGLLGAGIALLSGENLGGALAGGLQGAKGAQSDYMEQAKMAYDMGRQARNDTWENTVRERQLKKFSKEDERDEALANFAMALPEDQRALAEAYPEEFGELYAKAKMKAAFPELGGGAEYGLNPIVVQNPQTGEFQLLQPSKDGSAPKPIQFPEGFQYAPSTRTLDVGTGYTSVPTKGIPSQYGQTIPKDIVGEETAKAEGKGRGDALVSLESIRSKMPGLEKVVADLDALAEKATYTLSGQAFNMARKELGFEPTEGAIARTQYQVTVANQILPLLRDTFGAQFTQAEGERLLATLGDPDTTPAEKQATLKAFIEQKRRDVEALAAQAGQVIPAPAPAPAQSGDMPDFSKMTDEELEAIINGQQ